MLLDSDVMVDILRVHQPAVTWLGGLGKTPVGLPGLVAMELLQGCQNLAQQQQLEKRFASFTFHWPTAIDCERAYLDFAAHRLSHNLGLLDALIAATAVGLNEPLATINLKHYKVVSGLQTVQPC